VGQWRDHLPYSKTIDVCLGEGHVYGATATAVIDVNTADNSMTRINKANMLSDVGISAIEYDIQSHTLIVGFDNGNLDLITSGIPLNLSDIKRSSLIGDKEIYHILPYSGMVYLACGFGIVVIDILKQEVAGTYFIGEEGVQVKVLDLDVFENHLYATTADGILFADLDEPFIASFEVWQQETDLPTTTGEITDLEFFAGTRFINEVGDTNRLWKKNPGNLAWEVMREDTIYEVHDVWSNSTRMVWAARNNVLLYDAELNLVNENPYHFGQRVDSPAAVADENDVFWFANNKFGLCRHSANDGDTNYQPPGPEIASTRRLAAYNNNLWIAHGGVDASNGNLWMVTGISSLVDEQWNIVPNPVGINEDSVTRDMIDVAIDPLDNSHIYLGSWEEGLIEVKNGQTSVFNTVNCDDTNLDLGCEFQSPEFTWFSDFTAVAGVTFDTEGILWCTNSFSTKPLHARDRSGNFYAFDFAPAITANERVADVMVTSTGYVWAIITNRGLLVLNTGETLASQSDDTFKILTDVEAEGGLPVRDVLCMKEDLDAEVWVGTLQGIAVYYNQECLFTDEPCDAEQILISQDGNIQILLETEAITAIEIDGSNRKWVGTQNSGVYLFSDDGLQQIYHFTEENSPLLSENIFDIAVNHLTGEVFFATEKGIVSFLSDATNFYPDMESVRVFPNPVRPLFEGVISIDGLAYDTDVKITDTAGNLIYTTTSQGGRATWNAKNLSGEDVVNGLYFVFAGNALTKNAAVAKIAVVR